MARERPSRVARGLTFSNFGASMLALNCYALLNCTTQDAPQLNRSIPTIRSCDHIILPLPVYLLRKMLRALGLSNCLVTGLVISALVPLESYVYALPSQQNVLSWPVNVEQSPTSVVNSKLVQDKSSGSGLLKRFLASEVDLEEVLAIALVSSNTLCNSL